MKLYTINNRKDFMGKLLNSDCFDAFLLQEATIRMACSYVIDGKVNTEFYQGEVSEENNCLYDYAEWKTMRSLCFQLIKGKMTPLSFHFILSLKPEHLSALLKQATLENSGINVSHFLINIKFDQSGLSITSGVSYTAFSLNKDGEALWDKSLTSFLSNKEIDFEIPVSFN